MSKVAAGWSSFVVALAAVALWWFTREEQVLAPSKLLQSLRLVRDTESPRAKEAKVALGYNVCLDAVVDVFELFKEAQVHPPKEPRDFPDIRTKEQLAATFLLHFMKAAGGERAVTERSTFSALENSLQKTKHRKHLGGNAAIMAVVLADDFGFEHVLLGGQVGPALESLLPDSISTVGLESGKSVFGGREFLVRDDETHLILEYDKGSSWTHGAGKTVSAARANRFIISHDISNAVLAPLEPMNEMLTRDGADFDILIAAGFHMLDVMEPAFRSARLKSIVESMQAVPLSTRIHFELASVGDPTLMRSLASSILPLVDSLGLNEQELGSLYVSMGLNQGAGEVDLSVVTATIPEVSVVASVLERILIHLNDGRDADRALSRIHFHSFAYHIIVQYSENDEKWPHMVAAVAAGSVKAAERACNRTSLTDGDITFQLGTEVVEVDKDIKVRFSYDKPVLEWHSPRESKIHYALAPVLTCNKPLQTVGLGDSISASALAYQI